MQSQFEGSAHRVVLLIFLGVALYGCYWMVKPFLQPIIMAILIGLLAYPAHERLVSLLRGRETIASLISCLALLLIILLPTLVLLVAVLKQGISYSLSCIALCHCPVARKRRCLMRCRLLANLL